MIEAVAKLLADDVDVESCTLEQGRTLLEFANDSSNPLDERRKAEVRANDIRKALSVGRSNFGKWPGLSDDSSSASTSVPATTRNSNIVNAGRPANKTSTPAKTKPAENRGPLVAGIVYVANDLQAWLYKNFFMPHLIDPNGRWGDQTKPQGHGAPFKIARVVVNPTHQGITFGADATKRNYNLNDSTKLKPEDVNPILERVSADLKRKVEKKELASALESLKKLFSIDVKPLPEDLESNMAGSKSEPEPEASTGEPTTPEVTQVEASGEQAEAETPEGDGDAPEAGTEVPNEEPQTEVVGA